MGEFGKVRRGVSGFARDEEGTFIVFGLFIFVLLLLACGMGLDMMRLEAQRVKLQTTVDRAALAAANLNQQLAPKDVVADYFAKAGLSEFLSGVKVTEDVGFRNVEIETALNMPTHFMNLAGIDTLPARAAGAAEESIGDVEISMVLDVSGSMNRYNRLTNLKAAAGDFVDTVYSSTTRGIVSTSIVPYATQVNAGPKLLANYNLGAETHDYSHCVNFTQDVFGQMGLSTETEMQQTQHFDPWYNTSTLRLPVCRDNAGVEILAWSRDPKEIKDRVNAFVAGGNTSTDIGVKWGNALLDPGSRQVLTNMADAGTVDNELVGRPYDYGEIDAMKVMVVMSDGVHTDQYFMTPNYRGSRLSSAWATFNGNKVDKFSIWSGRGSAPEADDGWQTAGNEFYHPHDGDWHSTPVGGAQARRLTFQELWSLVPVRYHAYRHIGPAQGSGKRTAMLAAYSSVPPVQKNANLLQACQAAKNEGVIVFTVGLEVTRDSGVLLEACATSPNHYFLVDGQDLSYAFKSIAGQINQLRLTQ